MHNLWSCRLILLGCTPVFSSSRQWAAVSPWDSSSILPLCILLQPRTRTIKHSFTWKDNPELLRGCNCMKANENPGHGTLLRAVRLLQAQKSKNVMPERSCCLALAVPASLSTWLFFFEKESPRNCSCAGSHRSWMMQGSLSLSWGIWVEVPLLPQEHKNPLLLPRRLPGPPCCCDGRHGPLLSSPWKQVTCVGRRDLGLKRVCCEQGAPPCCLSWTEKRMVRNNSVVGNGVKALPFLVGWHIAYLQFWRFLHSTLCRNSSQWYRTRMKGCEEKRERRGSCSHWRGRGWEQSMFHQEESVLRQKESSLKAQQSFSSVNIYYGGACLALTRINWGWPIKYCNKDNSHLFYIMRLPICVVNSVITPPKLHAWAVKIISHCLAWGKSCRSLIFKGKIFQIFYHSSCKHKLGNKADTQLCSQCYCFIFPLYSFWRY